MTSGAKLPGGAILAENDLRETRTVALKFMISLFAKRGLTPELSRAAKRRRLGRIVSPHGDDAETTLSVCERRTTVRNAASKANPSTSNAQYNGSPGSNGSRARMAAIAATPSAASRPVGRRVRATVLWQWGHVASPSGWLAVARSDVSGTPDLHESQMYFMRANA